jgi:hypothetical protein
MAAIDETASMEKEATTEDVQQIDTYDDQLEEILCGDIQEDDDE